MNIEVDAYRCRFCGACQEIAPDTFQVDDETRQININEDACTEPDLVSQAAAWCPAHCIEIYDEEQ